MGSALDVPRGYTEPGLEFMLQALAFHGGNSRRAVEAMKNMDEGELRELGIDKVPEKSSLARWKDRYHERYAVIRNDKVINAYRQRAAEAHNAHADDEMEVAGEILQLLRDNAHKLTPNELANALRNVDTGAAINRDKALALTGDSPSGIQVNINISDQLRSMAAQGTPFYDNDGNKLSLEEAIAKSKAIDVEAKELPKGEGE